MEDAVTAAGQPGTVTFVRFVLRLEEPGGVSVPAPIQQGEPDALVDTDPQGRPQLPGTSIAGVLRARVCDVLGPETARRLFGHLTPPPQDSSGPAPQFVNAVASPVWVLGSRLVDETGKDVPAQHTKERLTRWSTAIDRHRGAASTHTLRSEEMMPAGTRFEAFLRWDDADPGDLNDVLAVIAVWRPIIGRGTSLGRGRCSVDLLRHGTLRLDQPEDLLRWLTSHGPGLARHVARTSHKPAGDPVTAADDLLADVLVTVGGPLHIGNRGSTRDREPAQPLEEGNRVMIPGSGLKGVLRSRMEYVLRSVGVRPEACPDQQCGRCRTCRYFGHGGGQDRESRSVGARANVRIPDAEIQDARTRVRTHVAIDRFTGGAAMRSRSDTDDEEPSVATTGSRRGLLYAFRVVEHGSFRLRVENDGLTDAEKEEFRGLLRLVLADIDDGLIGFGRGTARGYGTVRVDAGSYDSLPDIEEARATLAAMTDGQEKAS